ncbi:MAG: ABC transporter substrate-binding protein, partial [Bradyrhizobium sp.]
MSYCRSTFSAVAALVLLLAAEPAWAQSRAETLRYVTGASVNTLDPNVPGTTREAFAVSL